MSLKEALEDLVLELEDMYRDTKIGLGILSENITEKLGSRTFRKRAYSNATLPFLIAFGVFGLKAMLDNTLFKKCYYAFGAEKRLELFDGGYWDRRNNEMLAMGIASSKVTAQTQQTSSSSSATTSSTNPEPVWTSLEAYRTFLESYWTSLETDLSTRYIEPIYSGQPLLERLQSELSATLIQGLGPKEHLQLKLAQTQRDLTQLSIPGISLAYVNKELALVVFYNTLRELFDQNIGDANLNGVRNISELSIFAEHYDDSKYGSRFANGVLGFINAFWAEGDLFQSEAGKKYIIDPYLSSVFVFGNCEYIGIIPGIGYRLSDLSTLVHSFDTGEAQSFDVREESFLPNLGFHIKFSDRFKLLTSYIHHFLIAKQDEGKEFGNSFQPSLTISLNYDDPWINNHPAYIDLVTICKITRANDIDSTRAKAILAWGNSGIGYRALSELLNMEEASVPLYLGEIGRAKEIKISPSYSTRFVFLQAFYEDSKRRDLNTGIELRNERLQVLFDTLTGLWELPLGLSTSGSYELNKIYIGKDISSKEKASIGLGVYFPIEYIGYEPYFNLTGENLSERIIPGFELGVRVFNWGEFKDANKWIGTLRRVEHHD